MADNQLRFIMTPEGENSFELDFDPVNWREVERNWKRSQDFAGITYSFTNEFQVVGNGASKI